MRGPFVRWVAVFTGLVGVSGVGYASAGALPAPARATSAPTSTSACTNMPACTKALADAVAPAGSDLCACNDERWRSIACDESHAGALAYGEATKSLWACVGHGWTPISQDARSLVLVAPMAPGSQCPSGGEEIRVGLDTNGDGALEANELQRSYDVCDTSAARSTK